MTKLKLKIGRLLGENIKYHKKISSKYKALLQGSGQTVSNKISNKPKSVRKLSDFGKRLLNTKKLSIFYGNLPIRKIQKNQLYSYLDKQKALLLNLETRLDVILVRANLFSTLYAARQWIIHRKICVNSKIVNYPSFNISNGDIINIPFARSAARHQYRQVIQTSIKKNSENGSEVATLNLGNTTHLEINYKTLSVILLYEPSQVKIPYKIDFDFI